MGYQAPIPAPRAMQLAIAYSNPEEASRDVANWYFYGSGSVDAEAVFATWTVANATTSVVSAVAGAATFATWGTAGATTVQPAIEVAAEAVSATWTVEPGCTHIFDPARDIDVDLVVAQVVRATMFVTLEVAEELPVTRTLRDTFKLEA